MSDFSKLNIRFSNMGLNVAHTAGSLDFGQWTQFKNARSEYEGQVTARLGFTNMSSQNAAGGAILGLRKLNNSVNSQVAYFAKASDGKVYVTYTSPSGQATINTPFSFVNTGITGISSTFGSFIIERPSLSASVWLYLGDSAANWKLSLDNGGHVVTKTLGIKRPTGPPTFVVQAGGSLTASSQYNYRYTLYDKNTGTESLFNSTEATAANTTASNKQIQVTIPTETINSAVTHVRVYRQGGTLSTWNRISDDGATYAYTGSTINFVDSGSDLSIAASTLLDTISDQPFSITQTSTTVLPGQPLPRLFGPYLGYVLGCGDPINPGLLYWCNKYNPDSQNPANNIEVSSPQDPLQNGTVYNGLGYVFSREALYAIYPGLSETTFTPSKTSCARGLWTPQAFCVGPQLYFLSKDGIFATSGGLEQAMTDNELRPIFDPKQTATTINGIGVVDYASTDYMFMNFYKNEVWFQYKGKDGNTHALVFDVRYHRWRHVQGILAGVTFRSLYADEQSTANLIAGGNDGNIYNDLGTSDGGVALPVVVQTGQMTFGAPLIVKEFNSFIFDVDPSNTVVTLKAYKDKGVTLIDANQQGFTGRASGTGRQRVSIDLADINLGNTFTEDLTLQFSWATTGAPPIMYGYEILYKMDVTTLTNYRQIGVDHGILGWQILRSGYFTYRSDGTLTLNVTLEGQGLTFVYTLPSTSNQKRKIFVPFDPIKAKLFTYKILVGTATYFSFYPEESEVHVKPWISSTGYASANPFRGGGEVPNFIGQGAGQGSQTLVGDGGGAGANAPFSAGGIIPGFDFSGLGGGIGIGPGQAPEEPGPDPGGVPPGGIAPGNQVGGGRGPDTTKTTL